MLNDAGRGNPEFERCLVSTRPGLTVSTQQIENAVLQRAYETSIGVACWRLRAIWLRPPRKNGECIDVRAASQKSRLSEQRLQCATWSKTAFNPPRSPAIRQRGLVENMNSGSGAEGIQRLVQRLRRNIKFHAPFVCNRDWRQDRECPAKDKRAQALP